MNTNQTPPPEVLGSPSGSAACPVWKTPKHIHDKQEQEKIRAMTVAEALPSSVHRLGWLEDRDKQLHDLLDYAQSVGIPMGSSTWAKRIMLKLIRLEAESRAAHRVMSDDIEGRKVDIERLKADFDHARAMNAKHLPPMETRCDWCGWPGASPIGEGNAACEDCLPNASGETREQPPATPPTIESP